MNNILISIDWAIFIAAFPKFLESGRKISGILILSIADVQLVHRRCLDCEHDNPLWPIWRPCLSYYQNIDKSLQWGRKKPIGRNKLEQRSLKLRRERQVSGSVSWWYSGFTWGLISSLSPHNSNYLALAPYVCIWKIYVCKIKKSFGSVL